MKKTSSPTQSCSHLLLTVTALLFLSIPTNAQWKTHQIFHNGIRLNDSGALSLHPNIPFEIDEPNVVGGRFRVTTTGLVGIGVISPTEKLEVNGNIKATGKIIADGGIEMNGSEALHFSKDGNVGIGVTEPTERLEVNGNITTTSGLTGRSGNPYLGHIAKITFEDTGLWNKKTMYFSGHDDESFIRMEQGILSLHPDVPFEMDSKGIRGGRLIVTKDGNVGIGVTAPTEKLQVAGNIKATGKIIADGGIEMNGFEALHFSKEGNVGIGTSAPTERLEVNGNIKATGKIIADGGIEMNGSEALHFSKEGNVGIGTTTPTEKLDVNGSINVKEGIISKTVLTQNLIISKNFQVEPVSSFGVDEEIGGKKVFGGRFIILGNGNIGIGTTTPTEKLEVDGKIKADGIRIKKGLLSLHPNATFNIDEPNIVGGRFTIGKDGNVGIGVTAPTEKLQVAGNIKATGNLLLENDDDPDNPIPVFQVSTAEQLTFIGSEAYTKWTENNTNKDSELYKNKDKYSLWVSKGIVSEDYVMASVDAWADYVFDPGYKLRSLEELSHFVRTNKHLPNIPSEAEVKQEGYSLHELNRGFLKTIEELTLHTIAQEEKMKTLNSKLEQLKAALAQLQQDQD